MGSCAPFTLPFPRLMTFCINIVHSQNRQLTLVQSTELIQISPVIYTLVHIVCGFMQFYHICSFIQLSTQSKYRIILTPPSCLLLPLYSHTYYRPNHPKSLFSISITLLLQECYTNRFIQHVTF